MKEVKIVRFNPSWKDQDKKSQANINTYATEEKLAVLINDGWEIVSSGGGSYAHPMFLPAFVILVRER